jgi:hypothetical protein
METRDEFGGFRKVLGCKLALAVARESIWDETKQYDVPAGYRWASTREFLQEATMSMEPPEQKAYYKQGKYKV